jgi:hypothetical protein
MPESRDHRSVVDAAEKAAGAGDYATAERLLREAAALQEAELGAQHPDFANTLNNLGIVCEITQKPDDAERFFRRAFGIASAALKPGHPFVATSRKNLEDFCRARGKPVDLPLPAPPTPRPAPVERKKPIARPPDPPRARERRVEAAAAPVGPSGWSRPLAIAVLVAIALVVTFIATPLFRSKEAAEAPAAAPAAPPPGPVPAPVDARIQPSAPAPKPAAPAPKPEPAAVVPSAPARRGEKGSARTVPPVLPVIVEARLCRDLETDDDWECASPRSPAGAGPLFFYTRLKSPVDTTVQHRWYRGNRVRQVVELRVRANTNAGYRTYSRNTINDLDQADWRVELTTSDGTLLKEIRFTVR